MEDKIKALEQKASELRRNIISMIYIAQSGHPGGSLSLADIMTVLYYDELKINPENPYWEERDRFILSKGHTAPVLYSVLAMKGYFHIDILCTLRKLGSILQGHPDMKKVPGVDMTTGSLGQGLSIGVGMAIGAKANNFASRIFVALGDGETNEGQVWEAAMTAVKYKLDNLIAIIDKNNLQNDNFTGEVMPIENMDKRWKAFGWEVLEVDGHNIGELLDVFDKIKSLKGKPICIIANTVKGKGVSFMENICNWHGTAPNDEQYEIAMNELTRGEAI